MKPTPNLTRSIFRSIIANRPYTVPGCRARLARQSHLGHRYPQPLKTQSRQLFGLSWGKTARGLQGAKSTPSNLERALTDLANLEKSRQTQSRLPPDEEVIAALRLVFASHAESRRDLSRNELHLVIGAFSYFSERGLVGVPENNAISPEDLQDFLHALAEVSGEASFRTDKRNLASTIYSYLGQLGPESTSQSISDYVTILSRTGAAKEALELLEGEGLSQTTANISMYIITLEGLQKEGRVELFNKAVNDIGVALKAGGEHGQIVDEELTMLYARFDRLHEVVDTQKRGLSEPTTISTTCLIELVDCGARNDAFEWSQPLVNELKRRSDHEGIQASVLRWVSAQYQNTADVLIALEELSASNQSQPRISTFNTLIEFAYSKSNTKLATEYIQLAQSLGLRFDAKSYALQLRDALARKDLVQAKNIAELMAVEEPPEDDSDIPVLNKYIASLAFAEGDHYEEVMRTVDTLVDRGADLDAEAISGLCRMYLLRDDIEEVSGILRYRVNLLPPVDRARISSVFVDYITSTTIKDQRAYNAYDLFRQAFPETPVEARIPIMRSFFYRKRPDLACLVFGHMRQREDTAARPTPEAYAQCFAGIAECKDIDGLQMVYNMLKLDLEVDPTTKIRNGLMAAYTACHQPFTAIIDHFWKILDSREGPTMSSFMLALRACEIWIPQGAQEARRIIALLQAWQLEIDKPVYDCYIGALAGQSEFENVVELIEHMHEDIGDHPDAFTIGTFYNAIPWQFRKDEVEKWAKATYPDLWDELVTYGDEIDEEWEMRYFKIDRRIDMEDDLLFDADEYDPQVARQMHASLEVPSK